MRAHVFRGPAEHYQGCLNQEILENFEVKQRRVLVLLFEVRVDPLDGVLNFFDSDEEVKIVIAEEFPDVCGLHEVGSVGDVVEEFDGIGSEFAAVVVVVDSEQFIVPFSKVLNCLDVSFLFELGIIER